MFLLFLSSESPPLIYIFNHFPSHTDLLELPLLTSFPPSKPAMPSTPTPSDADQMSATNNNPFLSTETESDHTDKAQKPLGPRIWRVLKPILIIIIFLVVHGIVFHSWFAVSRKRNAINGSQGQISAWAWFGASCVTLATVVYDIQCGRWLTKWIKKRNEGNEELMMGAV